MNYQLLSHYLLFFNKKLTRNDDSKAENKQLPNYLSNLSENQ